MVHPGPIEPARIASALTSLASSDDPATAIITGNASTTIAVIRLLGADFGTTALVGFDDFPLADLLRPGLTVVAQGEAEIGRTTIDLLRTRLADPPRPIQTVTVPTRLIPRGSGELPA
jgi:LacI family transcriptional regulator